MTIPEIVLILSVSIPGIAALVTAMAAAKKTQLEALAGIVKLLQDDNTRILMENKRLMDRVEHLEAELEERDGTLKQVQAWAEVLVHTLQKNGIEVPEMPAKENTKPRS